MTKQEKIEEVFESNYIYADTNGWVRLGRFHWNELGFVTSEIFYDEELDIWRPLSLQGIETNNGWIKIESEEDLPTIEGSYFVFSKVNYKPYYRIDIFTGRLSNSFENGKSCFSHYQQIIKPQPPIY